MRYFFHIAYNGGRYYGWQRQPALPTVQQTVEEALTQIFKKPCYVTGCGRTDAHVNASQFFFHCDLDQTWKFDLLFRLNKVLPADIVVHEILPVAIGQHARHDAYLRTYNYFIHRKKDPFLAERSALYEENSLDLRKMNEAAKLFLRYKDYRAFCKAPDGQTHTLCNIQYAQFFTNRQQDRLRFEITSNRFLTKMVRILMGKLLDVGRERLSVDELESYFVRNEPLTTLDAAYPQGLYLSKVTYRYLDLPTIGMSHDIDQEVS